MRIIWARKASNELQRIFAYIARDSPQNAYLVIDRVYNSVGLLESAPFLGTPAEAGQRRITVPQSGFVVYYQIFGESIRITSVQRGKMKR